MKVVCIGSGYVGSVTSAAFAALGHSTTVVDTDAGKVDAINRGESPIYEPGLDKLIAQTAGKTLSASSKYDDVRDADAVFICVGTPSNADGSADLRYVRQAAQSIAAHLLPGRLTVVVTKSTVPVGTTDLVAGLIEDGSGLKNGKDFTVASNPEFLREGYALEDVFLPDRIVVGTEWAQAKQVMSRLYAPVLQRTNYEQLQALMPFPEAFSEAGRRETVYFETDAKSAEMIKYASNSFLAVKISYVNELAMLCETLGANGLDVSAGMGLDRRIGNRFLQISPGWSGSCFPKDTQELLTTSRNYNRELSLVKAAIESNLRMHQFCVQKLQTRMHSLNGKRICILGLTFKPNTDDARQTQAAEIIAHLLRLGAQVQAHDPRGMEMFRRMNPGLDVQFFDSPTEAARHADAVMLLTHWEEYIQLDWQQVFAVMKKPYALDTRNVLPLKKLAQIGFTAEGLGYAGLDSFA